MVAKVANPKKPQIAIVFVPKVAPTLVLLVPALGLLAPAPELLALVHCAGGLTVFSAPAVMATSYR